MSFQDVALLPSRDSSPPHISKNCVRGESLDITTCLKTVVGGKQGHTPVKYFRSSKASFCVT